MKKILIAVLAVAVLFGFAACNDGSSSTAGGAIAGATVTGGEKVYIPGEEVDLSDYTFTLTMADGTPKAANGSDFVFPNGLKTVFGSDTQSFVGYYQGIQDVYVVVKAKVATVEKITLEGTLANDTYYATTSTEAKYTNDLLDLTGLTVTATYDYKGTEGTKPVALDNKYLTAEISDSDWDAAGEVDITVKFNGTVSATYKSVTLLDNLVKAIELKATEGYKVISGTTSTDYKLAYTTTPKTAKGVYVEATYQNGETEVLTTASGVTLKFATEANTAVDKMTAQANIADLVSEGDTNVTLYANCAGVAMIDGCEKKLELPLTVEAKAPTKLSITLASGTELVLDDSKDYTDTLNDTTFKNLFVVKAVYNDKTESNKIESKDFTVIDPVLADRDFDDLKEGDRITIKVTATHDDVALEGEATFVIGAAGSVGP